MANHHRLSIHHGLHFLHNLFHQPLYNLHQTLHHHLYQHLTPSNVKSSPCEPWSLLSHPPQVFYWTHFLYLLFWLLCVLHAPAFWKWFVGPFAIFAMEKIISLYKSHSEEGKSYVTTGVVLPSRVVCLVIKRPPNFSFKPGDYVYLNIPSIAQFEWHPFTISSAPEQTKTLSLHIRAVGHWTNSLYQYFEKEQARLEGINTTDTNKKSRRVPASWCKLELTKELPAPTGLIGYIKLQFKMSGFIWASQSRMPGECTVAGSEVIVS